MVDELCSLKTLKSLMTLTTLKNEKSVADMTTDFLGRGISRLHSGITDAEFERRKYEVVEQMYAM